MPRHVEVEVDANSYTKMRILASTLMN